MKNLKRHLNITITYLVLNTAFWIFATGGNAALIDYTADDRISERIIVGVILFGLWAIGSGYAAWTVYKARRQLLKDKERTT